MQQTKTSCKFSTSSNCSLAGLLETLNNHFTMGAVFLFTFQKADFNFHRSGAFPNHDNWASVVTGIHNQSVKYMKVGFLEFEGLVYGC